jgi:hypothetical protein
VVDVHSPEGEEGTHLVVVAEDTLKLQWDKLWHHYLKNHFRQDFAHGVGSSQEGQRSNYRNKISSSRADPSQQAGREDGLKDWAWTVTKQEQLITILAGFCSCDDLK